MKKSHEEWATKKNQILIIHFTFIQEIPLIKNDTKNHFNFKKETPSKYKMKDIKKSNSNNPLQFYIRTLKMNDIKK